MLFALRQLLVTLRLETQPHLYIGILQTEPSTCVCLRRLARLMYIHNSCFRDSMKKLLLKDFLNLESRGNMLQTIEMLRTEVLQSEQVCNILTTKSLQNLCTNIKPTHRLQFSSVTPHQLIQCHLKFRASSLLIAIFQTRPVSKIVNKNKVLDYEI